MKSWVPSKMLRGFTLVEILIIMAIMSLLFGFTAVGAAQLSRRLLVDPSDTFLEHILTTASRRARDGVEASDWGVYLPYDEGLRTLGSITVFKGSSYATRDSTFDQTFTVSDRIDFVAVDFSGALPSTGNDHEVVFKRYSGETAMFGSIELDVFGVERSVAISSQGIITREL